MRVDNRLKEAVARAAAAGKLGRSGAKVLELVKRFKYFNQNLGMNFKSGNQWVEPTMRKYLGELQRQMTGAHHPIYSIAWDASRLSGLDLLFATVYAPHIRRAAWCPPMAPRRSGPDVQIW